MPDDTPAYHGRSHPSGEFPDFIHGWLSRIERKIDDLHATHADNAGQLSRMDERVKAVERWQTDKDADRRQMSVGTVLAIIGAVASPIAVIFFELLRNTPHP